MSTAASLSGHLAILLTALAVGIGGHADAALGADPPASAAPLPATEESESLAAWLSGPFGRVPGLIADAAPGPLDAGSLVPLDTFVRRAPLRLDLGDPKVAFASWAVSASAITDAAAGALLGEGYPASREDTVVGFSGPDAPGDYLVRADVRDVDGRTGRLLWRISVPDQEPPADGVLDLPAPLVILATPAASTSGQPGNGCYVYTCVEIGRAPPAEALTPLEVTAGEPLTVRLSDGSAIVSWSVMYQPAQGGDPSRVEQPAGEPRVEVTLEAPPAGEWLVSLVVVFDRERGWFETLYRLAAR